MEIIPLQIQKSDREVAVLLIQEAVRLSPSFGADIYFLEEDAKKRGVLSNFKAIDYAEMLEMIYAADTVISW